MDEIELYRKMERFERCSKLKFPVLELSTLIIFPIVVVTISTSRGSIVASLKKKKIKYDIG